jgi:hypothetical protein
VITVGKLRRFPQQLGWLVGIVFNHSGRESASNDSFRLSIMVSTSARLKRDRVAVRRSKHRKVACLHSIVCTKNEQPGGVGSRLSAVSRVWTAQVHDLQNGHF